MIKDGWTEKLESLESTVTGLSEVISRQDELLETQRQTISNLERLLEVKKRACDRWEEWAHRMIEKTGGGIW